MRKVSFSFFHFCLYAASLISPSSYTINWSKWFFFSFFFRQPWSRRLSSARCGSKEVPPFPPRRYRVGHSTCSYCCEGFFKKIATSPQTYAHRKHARILVFFTATSPKLHPHDSQTPTSRCRRSPSGESGAAALASERVCKQQRWDAGAKLTLTPPTEEARETSTVRIQQK